MSDVDPRLSATPNLATTTAPPTCQRFKCYGCGRRWCQFTDAPKNRSGCPFCASSLTARVGRPAYTEPERKAA